jgi:hypothetical protein
MTTVDTWRGMTKGYPVKVRGQRGSFIFRSATVHDDQVTSVCVVGGPSGHSLVRHFTPDRIIKRRKAEDVRPSGVKSSQPRKGQN